MITESSIKHWPSVLVSSIVSFIIIIVAVIFFVRARDAMQLEIRNRLTNVAAATAIQIDGDLIDQIHSQNDLSSPAYKEIETLLQKLRSTLPEIKFAYIVRKTDQEHVVEFVADADTALTVTQLDRDNNGRIDSYEEPALPGDSYDVSEVPALQEDAFIAPTADPDITYDQWGALVSGYAPIKDSAGNTVAVLGIDMVADDFVDRSQRAFSPLALIVVFFGGILSAVLAAYYAERRQITLLKRMNGERSGLLRLTFHQLGEPLTIMKWSLETLREETQNPDLQKLVDEHVVCMDEGLGRLNSIIDTLQLAEQVDLGTLEYVTTPTSLKSVIDNSIAEWTSTAKKNNQFIELDMSNDVTLPLDRANISLVLRQLLVNALEYSPPKTTIRVHVRTSDHKVKISVEDSGCGIPAKDMEHLFEKYRRASNAHLQKPDGNGLGLYIARGIVERAGGHISVQSIEGRGTTVTFTLPRS